MSYILEALKKAQAERQLGSAPTIHTMPIPTATPDREQQGRTQLYLAAGGIALVLAVTLLWWRQTSAPATVPAPVAAAAAPSQAALIPTPVAPTPVIVVPKSPPAPAPVAVAAAPKPVSKPLPPPAPPVAAPAVAAPVAAPEENLPLMVQLPEAVQRDLPKVAFGGYMYSKNPADRLLLIDKVLRHEGEEVAPGLILEQLQPRAAVMNYRGTRYRVPY